MSVRHIYARDGEYIAVHRHHGGYVAGYSSSSDDDDGWLILGGTLLGAVLIYLFWKIILMGIIVITMGWLIWKFRRPLYRLFKWAISSIWKNISCLGRKAWHFTAAKASAAYPLLLRFLKRSADGTWRVLCSLGRKAWCFSAAKEKNEAIKNGVGQELARRKHPVA